MSRESNSIARFIWQSGQRARHLFNLRGVSFGSPAAIVTSMALIVGFDAEEAADSNGHYYVKGSADGVPLEFMIDTGVDFLCEISVLKCTQKLEYCHRS